MRNLRKLTKRQVQELLKLRLEEDGGAFFNLDGATPQDVIELVEGVCQSEAQGDNIAAYGYLYLDNSAIWFVSDTALAKAGL